MGMKIKTYATYKFLKVFLLRIVKTVKTLCRNQREVIETLPLEVNSDDFVFDNEILAQAVYFGFRIGEISCPAKYFEEASSIKFSRSVKYGFGVLGTTMRYFLQKRGLVDSVLFKRQGIKTSGTDTRGTVLQG